MFSFFLGGVELLGHIIILYLTFWGAAELFSKAPTPFYNFTSSVWGFQYTYILINTCYCLSFILSILVGVKTYLIVALMCISLVTKDFEHLFTCLLAIWIFEYHWEMSIQILCPFLIGLSSHSWVVSILYIFWVQVPYQMYDLQMLANIISYSVDCLFLFLKWYPLQHNSF